MNTINPGQDFDELPESYVIFITRNDILGYGLPIYHIEKKILEVNELFGDGSHTIYVNSKKQEDTELGRLMHDLNCKDADDMYSSVLAKRVYELKETQGGVEFMCREMEQIYSEGIISGEKLGLVRGEKLGLEKGEKLGLEKGEKLGLEKGERLGLEKGEKLGIEKGALKKAQETAISMAEDGMKPEKIAHFLKVSVDMVQSWIKNVSDVSK